MTRRTARRLRGRGALADAVWRFRVEGDELACDFARLLLLTDPQALPSPMPGEEETAWQCYKRNWRPRKPRREAWGPFWRLACATAAPLVPQPAEPITLPRAAPPIAAAPQPPDLHALAGRLAALEGRLALLEGLQLRAGLDGGGSQPGASPPA
ncbi:MAG TPA: hypothetical protein VE684_10730 [Crenalkalicoccus sp.]|nr:hypothetical protein [Crenalkalicoccus sp.]